LFQGEFKLQIPKNFTINFFCIGAQKAGTTSLRNALCQHPQLFIPCHREAHFTDVNENFAKGIEGLFHKHYYEYAGQKLIGNINPSLQIETRSIDRIWYTFGKEVKFIFIIRNPVDRAYSHYLMSTKRGLESLSFTDALKMEQNRLLNPSTHPGYYTSEPAHFEKNHYGYRLHSTYAFIIKHILSGTDSSNLKIILFDDFIKKQRETINEICAYLGVNPLNHIQHAVHSNEAQKPRIEAISKMLHQHSTVKEFVKKLLPNAGLRKKIRAFILNKNLIPLTEQEKKLPPLTYNEMLRQYFIEDIEETERVSGLNLSQWKQPR
jgi:hypothetical protein